MRAFLQSLGCPKNLVDGEVAAGCLLEDGWEIVPDPHEAEVLVLNTCAFLREAVAESLEAIRRLSALGKPLVVGGCLVQRYGRALRWSFPGLRALVGVGRWAELPRLLREGGAEALGPPCDARGPRLVSTFPFAYLKVAEGCSNRCSYCLIPRLRGPLRSRPAEEVLAEARALLSLGVRELVLVAQDLTSYGRDGAGARLEDLLARLLELPGRFWVRLLYCHPARLRPRLMELLGHSKCCPYLDLPVQHADDRILRAMGRRITRRRIARLVEELRRRVPGVVLRTTVMVGFPGEDGRAFGELVSMVRELEFDRLGAFCFSPEPGTPAAELPGRVPREVAEERRARIMELQEEISRRRQRRLVGRRVEVLVEAPGRGRTRGQAPEVDGVTFLRGVEVGPGGWAEVRVTGADAYDLWAEGTAQEAGAGGRAGACSRST